MQYLLLVRITFLTLASPNTIYVSEAGFFKTSGLFITNKIFFDLRIVTLLTPCTYIENKTKLLSCIKNKFREVTHSSK